MAKKIKTISILFGQDAVDRASFTIAEVAKVNGQWVEKEEPSQPCCVDGNKLYFIFENIEYSFVINLSEVLHAAQELADDIHKNWIKSSKDNNIYWYCYSTEEKRIQIPCNIPKGKWTLKVGLRTEDNPTKPGDKTAKVTGLLNFRASEPMTVTFK